VRALCRGLVLGSFLDVQLALHARTSVATTTFAAAMPVETPRAVTLSYLTRYELKWRLGLVPFTGDPPCALSCMRCNLVDVARTPNASQEKPDDLPAPLLSDASCTMHL
jgi:hypothetical protein